jgi:hypothetical protein
MYFMLYVSGLLQNTRAWLGTLSCKPLSLGEKDCSSSRHLRESELTMENQP